MSCDFTPNDLQKRLLKQSLNMSPTRVELELTEQCNIACKFCYNSQKPIISGIAQSIIERLEEEHVLEIILTGGEPMLHPDFDEILRLCSERFAKVMVQTNGTFITRSKAELFAELNVFGVNISLHGSETVHENLTRVKGSFSRAFTGIGNLVAAGVNVASNFVLTSQNVQTLSSTIDMLYEAGLRELTLTRFTPTGVGATNEYLALSRDNLMNALKLVDCKRYEYGDLKIILANSIPYCSLDEGYEFFCDYCHFGISRFYVDVDGNILMCGMSRIKIGNILNQTFSEIKASSDVYQRHVCGLDVPEVCIRCEHFRQCRGGCRAAAYAATGKVDGADPYQRKMGVRL